MQGRRRSWQWSKVWKDLEDKGLSKQEISRTRERILMEAKN